jgi:large subunit ribosomal protein L14e
MPVVEIGRMCIKTLGRESGKECVIIDIIDKSFVLITGPKSVSGVKRRRVNVSHLEPTETVLDISRGATDEEVEKAVIEMKKS